MPHRSLFAGILLTGLLLSGTVTASSAPAAGAPWAWGNNADGELGNGTVTPYGGISAPVQVKNLSGVTMLAGGGSHSLALKSDGTVWAWGNGGWGQLGTGQYGSSTMPVLVSKLSGVMSIAAGDLHNLALKSDGTVWAWGFNYYGQVGNGANGSNVLSPTQVKTLTGVTAIAAGNASSLALKSDGTVWAWGYDGLGQLGNGSSDENPHSLPTKVLNLGSVRAIAAGQWHSLAVGSDSTVWAWGNNQTSELGANTASTCSSYRTPCSKVPVHIAGLSGISSVAGGADFSLALKSDGTVWGWGGNGYGQLGNGTTTLYGGVKSPTKARLSGVTAIVAGDQHSVALRSDGTAWAAGDNAVGQLGNGTFAASSSPVQVGGLSRLLAIAAGERHSLAIQSP